MVFGGRNSWARQIKPRLPNVRFIDRTMLPNALSHAFFYKIIAEARKYKLPVRYFSFAGVEQLAFEDLGSN